MNNFWLYEEIKNDYNNNHYNKTILKIEKYFNMKNSVIFAHILDIYINCQIKLGLLDSAYNSIELMRKLFPYYYNESQLTLKYCQCGKINQLSELITKEKDKFSERDYYLIAKECFCNGCYQKAEELFQHLLENSSDNKLKKIVKEYLRKIDLYKKGKVSFVDTNYSYFKYQGQKLSHGHIIYVSKLRNDHKENRVLKDSERENLPYMVWKIDGEKIYAFPVVGNPRKPHLNILRAKKYPLYNGDRAIIERVVCIEERDVYKVIDKVNYVDYKKIEMEMYKYFCLNSDVPRVSKQFFIQEMQKELEVHTNDVIKVYDFEKERERIYFVCDFDIKNNKYKVIEGKLNDIKQFEFNEGMEITELSAKTRVLSILNIQDYKEKLIQQLPDNFKGSTIVGSIVEYNSMKLEVMMEEDDYYICLDRTYGFSRSYIKVEIIEKDIPLNIREKIPLEEFELHLCNLKDYITLNSSKVERRKLKFLSLLHERKKLKSTSNENATDNL